MIERNVYLNKLISSRENGFPKVITGIRRCGKSFLLSEIYKTYLKRNGISDKNIVELSLDKYQNAKYRNPVELDKYIRENCDKSTMNYCFIDEIQLVDTIINPIYTKGEYILAKSTDRNVIGFVDVVLGLSREKYIDLYVTGSNSKMLSTDIVTEFRDKATNITVHPLSFEEFYNYKNLSASDAIYEYMQYGGMPLAVLKDGEGKRDYLKELFTMTYIKDILEHNELKKSEALDELANIISECSGDLMNVEKISNTYKSIKKENINKKTIEKYLDYFKDAFLISEAKRYDIKGREEIGAQRKYYFVDNGLRNARINFAFDDEGKMLENMVYNELIYNGYAVHAGTFEKVEKDKNKKSIKKTYEIDFLAVRGPRRYCIQVASDISSSETRARELKPYIALNENIQKIVVINKPIGETLDSNGFTIIGIVDFLLRFIK